VKPQSKYLIYWWSSVISCQRLYNHTVL